MIVVETSQQVMSLLSPAPPLLPGALPPERRAALELSRAHLRAAPPIHTDGASRPDQFVTLSPVSTGTGEGHPNPPLARAAYRARRRQRA